MFLTLLILRQLSEKKRFFSINPCELNGAKYCIKEDFPYFLMQRVRRKGHFRGSGTGGSIKEESQLSSRPRFELAAARFSDGRINNAENGRQRQSWR